MTLGSNPSWQWSDEAEPAFADLNGQWVCHFGVLLLSTKWMLRASTEPFAIAMFFFLEAGGQDEPAHNQPKSSIHD